MQICSDFGIFGENLCRLLKFVQIYVTIICGFLFKFQVNLEYLARVVFDVNSLVYPDSLVGTDSHTTMINGLGVLGWGRCCCGCQSDESFI